MESTQAGFVTQLKGHLTTERYKAATIFIDHYSLLHYVHVMSSLTSKETIEAKQAFERFATDHGVCIKQYHTDNGRFADNAFKQHCSQQRQAITYCSVNAHFQNGIAERAIRDIIEAARTILLHAKARWPSAVHLSLWPNALRMAVHIHNTVPVLNSLAADNTIPKWSPRSCLGLNLGPSPNHTWNVNLVLNLNTELVSPQFHCRYNDFFETTKHSERDIVTSANWKQLSG
ncbi:hypothetical protein ACHAW6_004497, partial [Cyclotella cf. meneghiniana]